MDKEKMMGRLVQQKNMAGLVHRLSRNLSALSEHRWAADGYPDVRSGHVQLLANVDPEGTCNTVLAQRANITKQTMGRLVSELARSGYVSVRADEKDRRAQQVQLTELGQAFLVYLTTTIDDLERVFSQTVGERTLQDFTQTLHTLLALTERRRQDLKL